MQSLMYKWPKKEEYGVFDSQFGYHGAEKWIIELFLGLKPHDYVPMIKRNYS